MVFCRFCRHISPAGGKTSPIRQQFAAPRDGDNKKGPAANGRPLRAFGARFFQRATSNKRLLKQRQHRLRLLVGLRQHGGGGLLNDLGLGQLC